MIGGDLEVFGVSGGVFKFWNIFTAPWSILEGLDQCRAPKKSVTTTENPLGISPFHFECYSVNQSIF